MQIELERLGPEHQGLLDTLVCTKGYRPAELTEFLCRRALHEQAHDLSATFVLVASDRASILAYITVRATNYQANKELQEALGIDYPHVPAVMVDYACVHDKCSGKGIGQGIFDWMADQVFELNRTIGVRFITLDVRAGNWGAARTYFEKWGFRPLPLRPTTGEPEEPPPDLTQPNKPQRLRNGRMITMFYDLLEMHGAYWPRP